MKKPPETLEHFSPYNVGYKIIVSVINFDKNLHKDLCKAADPNKIIDQYISETHTTAIYTDGSKKSDKLVGLSCICPTLNIKIDKTIDRHASVYTAVCIALLEATKIAKSHPNIDFTIFSDCLSVLESLRHIMIHTKASMHIYKIKEIYNEICMWQTNKINFVFIPAHF